MTAAEAAVQVSRLTASGPSAEARDTVVVEAPLEIRLNGEPFTITMRTPGPPGADRELALGLLWAERVVESPDDLRAVREVAAPPGAGVVDVAVSEETAARWRGTRTLRATAACGVCGARSLEMLGAHGAIRAARDAPHLPRAVLFALPATMRARQTVFGATGGLHAAALFDTRGELLAIREDVGRHNALDKLAGWSLEAPRVDVSSAVLLVSGRLGFELVAKALSIGVPIVAAISAPSSLAVDVGLAHGMTIVGFLRNGSANVYAGDERIV